MAKNKVSYGKVIGKINKDGSITPYIQEEDIAPVKETKQSGLFKSSDAANNWSLSTGNDFLDFLQRTNAAIWGTAAEATANVGRGVTNMVEGIGDFAMNRVADIQDLAGNSKAAERTRRESEEQWGLNKKLDEFAQTMNTTSVLGDFSDQVFQGVGSSLFAMGTGAIGGFIGGGTSLAASIASLGSMGVGAAGNSENEARLHMMAEMEEKGYTREQINSASKWYGLLSGTAETISEMMFGGIARGSKVLGIGKGLFDSADDAVIHTITNKIHNDLVKTFVQAGLKASGEGIEEIMSGLGNVLAKKMTYMKDEDWGKLLEDEKLWESFLSGTLSALITQTPSIVKSANNTAKGMHTDYITGLSHNEEKVIDKLVEQRVAQETTSKSENQIRKEVTDQMKNLELSTREISRALGEERLEGNMADSFLNQIVANEHTGFVLTQNESNKIKTEKQQALLKDLDGLNNSKVLHNIYDRVNAIQGVNDSQQYHITTTEGLYKLGIINKNANGEYTLKNGKPYVPRGLNYKDGAIYINADVGLQSGTQAIFHEMFEGFKKASPTEYSQFKDMVREIVGEKAIQDEIASYKEMYEDVYNEDVAKYIEDEIINDKFGELAESNQFVDKIAGNRNVLERFVDAIKRMIKYVKGTPEEKRLMKLQDNLEKKFTELYKNTDFSKNAKGKTALSLTGEEAIQYAKDLQKELTQAKSNLTRAENAYKLARGEERMAQYDNMSQEEAEARRADLREKSTQAHEKLIEAEDRLDNAQKALDDFRSEQEAQYKAENGEDIAFSLVDNEEFEENKKRDYNKKRKTKFRDNPVMTEEHIYKNEVVRIGNKTYVYDNRGTLKATYDENSKVGGWIDNAKTKTGNDRGTINNDISNDGIQGFDNSSNIRPDSGQSSKTATINQILSEYGLERIEQGINFEQSEGDILSRLDNWERDLLKAVESFKREMATQGKYNFEEDSIDFPSKYKNVQEVENTSVLNGKDYTTNNKNATFSEQRLDNIISESISNYDDNYARAYVVTMTPDQFLGLTASERTMDRLQSEVEELDTNKLANERQNIFLDVNMETGKVTGHEGRHRMLALKNAGIEKVEMVIYPDSGTYDRYNAPRIDGMDLIGQDFQVGRGQDTHVGEMIPVSKANVDELKGRLNPDSEIRYSLNKDALKSLSKELGDQYGYNYLDANLYGRDKSDVARWLQDYTNIVDRFLTEKNIKVDNVYEESKVKRDYNDSEQMRKWIKENDITLDKLAENKKLKQKYLDLTGIESDSELYKTLDSSLDWYKTDKNKNPWLKTLEHDLDVVKGVYDMSPVIDEYATKNQKLQTAKENGFDKWLENKVDPLFNKEPHTTEEIMEEAIYNHGTTDDYSVAGYMTTDGQLLDFNDNGSGFRDDHRTISAFDLDMQEFMEEGAIRMQPEGNGFEIAVEPTEAQYDRLADYIDDYLKENGDTIYVDCGKEGQSYSANTLTEKIINDIKSYFETGTFPEQSEYATFYSLTDNKGRELSKQQQEYFKHSKVRDEDGKLIPVYHGTSEEINVFDKGRLGSNTGAMSANEGFFFVENKHVAEEYSAFSRPKYIKDLETEYQRLEKIAQRTGDWDAYNEAYLKYEEAELNYAYNTDNVRANAENQKEVYLNLTNPLIHDFKGEGYRDVSYYDLLVEAKQNGNDGAMFLNTYDGYGEHDTFDNPKTNIYVAFDSNQIKNVDNVNPTSNNDVRFSLSADDMNDLINREESRYVGLDNKRLNTELESVLNSRDEMTILSNNLQKEYKTFQETSDFKEALQNGDFDGETMQKATEYADKIRYYDNQRDLYQAKYEAINNLLMGQAKETRTPLQIVKQAEKHFGTTDNFKEAGYITTNGRLLDLSGAHEGGMKGRRSLDHRQINEIDTDMDTFISQGNIRVLPESGGINLEIEPNAKQYSKISDYIDYLNKNLDYDDIYVDIVQPNGTYDSARFKMGTPANKIISDIKQYYETGTFPKQSDYADFYYSLTRNTDITPREIAPLKQGMFTYGGEEIAPVSNVDSKEATENIAPANVDEDIQNMTADDINLEPFLKGIQDSAERQETRNKMREELNTKKEVFLPKERSGFKKFIDTLKEMFVNKNVEIDNLARDYRNPQIKFLADMLNSTAAEAQTNLNLAQTDNNGKTIGRGLRQIFNDVRNKGLYDAFNDYLLHWSNIDRHKQGKGSKVSSKTSYKIIKEYEAKYPIFKKLGNEVWNYSRNARHNLRDAGIISEGLSNRLGAMYPHYVPYISTENDSYFKDITEIKPLGVIKHARGGANQDTLLAVEEALTRYTYAQKKSVRQNELYKEIVNTIGDNVLIGGDTGSDYVYMDDSLYRDVNGTYLTAYENGEAKTTRISDELFRSLSGELEKQVKDLEQRLSFVTKPLQTLSKIRRDILTKWSLTFPATNALKDVQDAVFNSKYTADFIKNYPTALLELRQNTELARQFKALYGSGLEMGQYDIDSGLYNPKKGTKNFNFLKGVENANELIELAPRFAEFKSSIQNGATLQEAMYNAREVTTNFSRGGVIAKAMNRNGFTFLNASIQGFDKFIRNFSGENGVRGVVSSLAKSVIFGVAPAVFNELAFGWGDDKDEDYEVLPDYIKDNYYLFKTGDGKFIRIPKGRVLSVFGSAARRTLEAAQGEENAFEGYLKNVDSQIGINNPEENNIFAPLIQAYGSKNGEAWYGGDIVPTRLQNKPASEQYDSSIDNLSIWLGDKLGVSPYKLNYVLDQYTGGFGDIAIPMMTEEATSGADSLGEYLVAPIKDKFTADSTTDNKYVSDFYSKNDELTIKANSDKATDEDMLRKKYMSHVSSEMSELYKQRREIQSDNSLSKEEKFEKAQAIKDEINRLAKVGVKGYDNLDISGDYAVVNDDMGYYKNAKGEWTAINQADIQATEGMGLTDLEKSKYYGIKNDFYNIEQDYKAETEGLSEEAKKPYSAEKKRNIVDTIKASGLPDEAKAYLYETKYNDNLIESFASIGVDMDSYLEYKAQNFTADKDKNGKSISGSKKQKVYNYVNHMNIPLAQKAMIMKSEYESFNTYNFEIIEYIYNSDISYEEKLDMLKKLGFKVDGNRVTW